MDWINHNKPSFIILLLALALIGGGVLMLKESNSEPQTLTIKDGGNNIALNSTQTTPEVAGEQTKPVSQKTEPKTGLVNINTADQAELETLEGIGPTLAQRIIVYRETNGPFGSIEELKEVQGIGDKKFEGMKESVTIN